MPTNKFNRSDENLWSLKLTISVKKKIKGDCPKHYFFVKSLSRLILRMRELCLSKL